MSQSVSRPRHTIDTVLGPIKMIPECKGQAVCTNGLRCWETGECLRPYQCEYCHRSSDLPQVCRECGEAD